MRALADEVATLRKQLAAKGGDDAAARDAAKAAASLPKLKLRLLAAAVRAVFDRRTLFGAATRALRLWRFAVAPTEPKGSREAVGGSRSGASTSSAPRSKEAAEDLCDGLPGDGPPPPSPAFDDDTVSSRADDDLPPRPASTPRRPVKTARKKAPASAARTSPPRAVGKYRGDADDASDEASPALPAPPAADDDAAVAQLVRDQLAALDRDLAALPPGAANAKALRARRDRVAALVDDAPPPPPEPAAAEEEEDDDDASRLARATEAVAQRAALEALAAQNDALAVALRATPRDATVAAAELRVLEARLDATTRDYDDCRASHRADLARYRLELQGARDQFAAERSALLSRLRDEGLTVHELTKRCDALEAKLRDRSADAPALPGGAAGAWRASRSAVRALEDARDARVAAVTPPDGAGGVRREKQAFSDLLDSNALLLRELGVRD